MRRDPGGGAGRGVWHHPRALLPLGGEEREAGGRNGIERRNCYSEFSTNTLRRPVCCHMLRLKLIDVGRCWSLTSPSYVYNLRAGLMLAFWHCILDL